MKLVRRRMNKTIIMVLALAVSLGTTTLFAAEPDYSNFAPVGSKGPFMVLTVIGVIPPVAIFVQGDEGGSGKRSGAVAAQLSDGVIDWKSGTGANGDGYLPLEDCWNGSYTKTATHAVESPDAVGCYESEDRESFWLISNTNYSMTFSSTRPHTAGNQYELPTTYTLALFGTTPAPQYAWGLGFYANGGVYNGCGNVNILAGTLVPQHPGENGVLSMPPSFNSSNFCPGGQVSQQTGGTHSISFTPPVYGMMDIRLRVKRSGLADAAGSYQGQMDVTVSAQ